MPSLVSINPAFAWTDFVSDWMTYTTGEQTTEIHRIWSGIVLVGGACERRVWITVGNKITFPNLYVMLVAPPGSGKQIIEDVRHIWLDVEEPTGGKAFHVAPDNMTRASLVDELERSKQIRIIPNGTYIYHSLLIASEEFEHFLPAYDSAYVATLNALWNNRLEHRETRRHGPAKDVTVPLPQLNILGGVQPAYLAREFTENTWNTGIARRIIMVYADEAPVMDVFSTSPRKEELRRNLIDKLSLISEMYGEATWAEDAHEYARNWHLSGRSPEPSHSKLKSYNTSRTQQLAKLCLISAISRSGRARVELVDVKRALAWLLEAEKFMPDVFRAMDKKSDRDILEDLHQHVFGLWNLHRKAISTSSIYHFLSTRAPASSIDKLIHVAEQSNIIRRVPGNPNLWNPVPRDQHGVE